MDNWISNSDGVIDAAAIYGPVSSVIRPNMILAVIETVEGTTNNIRLDFVRRYRLPTSFHEVLDLQETGVLSEFAVWDFAADSFITTYRKAVEHRRPQMDVARARFRRTQIAYESIILPQPGPNELPHWCVAFAEIRELLALTDSRPVLDNNDLAILQLLKEGFSLREIGTQVGLSVRTVEHRSEKLKTLWGALSLHHLVALTMTSGHQSQ